MRALVAAALLALALLVPAGSAQQQELDPGYWQPSILPQIGLATYYAPGMMQYVHDYRIGRGQLPPCPECVGSVALLRAGDIGRKVWLQPPGGELAGPFQVVDCAQMGDIPPLLDRNWVVDVDYAVGQTWGMAGPLDNVIVWPDPSEGNQPPHVALPTQLYIDPRDVVITVPTLPPPTPAPGALPTRLPAPRSAVSRPPAPTPPPSPTSAPAPLTPVVTTPTPSGWAPPAGSPSPLPGAIAASGTRVATPLPPGISKPAAGDRTPGIPVFVAVTPGPEVALGRAGAELLRRPAGPTPPTLPTGIVSPNPRSETVSPAPTRAARPAPPAEPPWQRFWRALLKLMGAEGG